MSALGGNSTEVNFLLQPQSQPETGAENSCCAKPSQLASNSAGLSKGVMPPNRMSRLPPLAVW